MNTKFLLSSDNNNRNELLKKKIIHYYIANGDATIADLGREMDLSIPTVTKLVAELQDDGYILDFGKQETNGGRKPNIYGLNPASGYFVGVDMLKDKLNIAAIDFKGDKVQLEENIPYQLENTPASLEQFCKIIDDFIVYRCAADDYWLVVNAGNRDKDAAWVESHLFGDVDYRDEGDDWGQVALQGPKSGDILKKLCAEQYIPAKYYTFIDNVPLDLGSRTIHALVSQTGYTGEYGFELYCRAEDTVDLWHALLAAGEEYGLIPCGLGARDTLRLEASMPLYGHEMNEEITPKMAGLPCKLTGKDFIGRDALVVLGAPKLKRIGMKVVAASCASTATSIRWRARSSAGRPRARSRRLSAAASRWATSPPSRSRSAST